ncbi:hypothetical protein CY34DRAFT_799638 [Suillus luteus UH-Slu-Lm8-n1]|uniref:Tf2-1-like SH3-like domain-containing protein n=1 Tax=Suillus luteus UH-Slu-Lm8-n1 TaxID=930992 RepID=A0A0D0AZI2_9AGAM|nr:hypothetical protein CY34DRAFT_799638 [Suillus luteus UH-Slu-Lm8-n1]
MQKGDKHIAKFMPCYDSPYIILDMHPETSTYTLNLPNSPNIFPTFHSSQLRPFHPNDPTLFPSCDFPQPGPVVTKDGQMETLFDGSASEQMKTNGYHDVT